MNKNCFLSSSQAAAQLQSQLDVWNFAPWDTRLGLKGFKVPWIWHWHWGLSFVVVGNFITSVRRHLGLLGCRGTAATRCIRSGTWPTLGIRTIVLASAVRVAAGRIGPNVTRIEHNNHCDGVPWKPNQSSIKILHTLTHFRLTFRDYWGSLVLLLFFGLLYVVFRVVSVEWIDFPFTWHGRKCTQMTAHSWHTKVSF